MPSTACARCDAAGQTGNFCTSCGYDLRPPEPAVVTPRHRPADEPSPSPPAVVTCGVCGALNAKSRNVCARCHGPLRAGVSPPPAYQPRPDDGFGPALRVAAPPSRSPALLRAVWAVAAVVLLAVTGTLLAARGGGPFEAATPGGDQAALRITRMRASTAADGGPAARLADGNPATAWIEAGPGPGVGQWVEARLAGRARLARLRVWNGDQGGNRFLARNRVRELRIDVGESRFVVELLDVQGPQVVELPRPVASAQVRLTVLSVHGAAPDADTALSEVEVYGTPG